MISLDKSRIPPEKLNDPRIAEWEAAVLEALRRESYRKGLCLHEAAHAIYMERAGAARVTLHPAVALYVPESDEFEFGGAGVQADFGPTPVEVDALEIARWSVAGGVAKRLLIGGDDWGEEGGDQTDFRVFSAEASSHGLNTEAISEYWEQAQRDVEKDLRSPAFRRQLWERAREFERQLLEMSS